MVKNGARTNIKGAAPQPPFHLSLHLKFKSESKKKAPLQHVGKRTIHTPLQHVGKRTIHTPLYVREDNTSSLQHMGEDNTYSTSARGRGQCILHFTPGIGQYFSTSARGRGQCILHFSTWKRTMHTLTIAFVFCRHLRPIPECIHCSLSPPSQLDI